MLHQPTSSITRDYRNIGEGGGLSFPYINNYTLFGAGVNYFA